MDLGKKRKHCKKIQDKEDHKYFFNKGYSESLTHIQRRVGI